MTIEEPLISDTSSVKQEPVYAFLRREIFSPSKTFNAGIKFCRVTGPMGAESKPHTHPGDEIVFTLKGKNINYLEDAAVPMGTGQALAVPPEAEHSTRVNGNQGWEGLSFYCDDCPLLQKSLVQTPGNPLLKSFDRIEDKIQGSLHIKEIFSPLKNESAYISLSMISSQNRGRSGQMTNPGETVYYCLEGTVSIFFKTKQITLVPGMALLIPANGIHALGTHKSGQFRLISCSCALCPFIN